jgi:hypothetical protein
MKLHPEDPRLTASLLGELSGDEAKEVEQAIADDPALQDAVRELRDVCEMLKRELEPTAGTLAPEQRGKVLSIARSRDSLNKPKSGRTTIPWMIPLAAAAAVTVGFFLFQSSKNKSPAAGTVKNPTPEAADKELPERVRLRPMPGPADASAGKLAANTPPAGTHPTLPPLRTRGYVAAAEFPTLDLPVQSGKSSLEWIRQAILTRHERPSHEEVRVEEILNSFNLRPAGVTVVSRLPSTGWHPDDRSAGQTTHAATIASESLACPWKPSATLVIISIRGNSNTDCNIKAVFRANSANVSRYRLLGFSKAEGAPSEPMPTLLPAKGANTVAIEIEPTGTATDLGRIEWSVNDHPAAPVSLVRQAAAEPSNDARFAALICTYAQWLADDPKGLVDVEVLAGLARECASDTQSGDRVELLHLIDQSLGL